jgi:rhodanese-related sulfurtransferase
MLRIDLRSAAEARVCPVPAHIVLNIPKPPLGPGQIQVMAARLAEVSRGLPRHLPIEVFCAKGIRSQLGAAILRQAGFTNVTDLGGVEGIC